MASACATGEEGMASAGAAAGEAGLAGWAGLHGRGAAGICTRRRMRRGADICVPPREEAGPASACCRRKRQGQPTLASPRRGASLRVRRKTGGNPNCFFHGVGCSWVSGCETDAGGWVRRGRCGCEGGCGSDRYMGGYGGVGEKKNVLFGRNTLQIAVFW
jgi:hypothetical protein